MVEDINIKSAEETEFQANYRSGTLADGTMFLSEEKASSGITELADLLSKASQMEDRLEEIFDRFSNLRGFRGLDQVAYKEDNLFYNLAFDGNDYDNDSSEKRATDLQKLPGDIYNELNILKGEIEDTIEAITYYSERKNFKGEFLKKLGALGKVKDGTDLSLGELTVLPTETIFEKYGIDYFKIMDIKANMDGSTEQEIKDAIQIVCKDEIAALKTDEAKAAFAAAVLYFVKDFDSDKVKYSEASSIEMSKKVSIKEVELYQEQYNTSYNQDDEEDNDEEEKYQKSDSDDDKEEHEYQKSDTDDKKEETNNNSSSNNSNDDNNETVQKRVVVRETVEENEDVPIKEQEEQKETVKKTVKEENKDNNQEDNKTKETKEEKKEENKETIPETKEKETKKEEKQEENNEERIEEPMVLKVDDTYKEPTPVIEQVVSPSEPSNNYYETPVVQPEEVPSTPETPTIAPVETPTTPEEPIVYTAQNMDSKIKEIERIDAKVPPVQQEPVQETESGGNSFVPPLAGLAAAATAGVGAKMYLDKSEEKGKEKEKSKYIDLDEFEEDDNSYDEDVREETELPDDDLTFSKDVFLKDVE